LLGEQLGRPLLQWVCVVTGLGRALQLHLRTADDHHEKLVRTNQRHRGSCGHRRRDMLSDALIPMLDLDDTAYRVEDYLADEAWAAAQ
jgi:hypothetical protein